MIFNNDINLQIIRKFTQASDPVSCQFHLFIPGTFTAGIYPDGMTTQEPGRFHPAVMIADGLFTAGLVRIPQLSFGIDHDQQVFHAFTFTPVFQFTEIARFVYFFEVESVYIFQAFYSEFLPGNDWEIQRISFSIRISPFSPSFKIAVQGPLGQGNGEEHFSRTSTGIEHSRYHTKGG